MPRHSHILMAVALFLALPMLVPDAIAQNNLDASDLVMEPLPAPSKPAAQHAKPQDESPEALMDTNAIDAVAPAPSAQHEDASAPAADPAKNKGRFDRIIIDPGHGGNDGGCEGPDGLKESTLTLELADQLKQSIEKGRTTKVFLTREKDKPCSRQNRVAAAVSNKGDLLIQLHVGASLAPDARGVQVFCLGAPASADAAASKADAAYLRQSLAMAERLAQVLAKATDTPARAVCQIPSAVFADAPMPAVLIEVGFMTNPDDAAMLATPEYKEKVVVAITEAVTAEWPPDKGPKP